jgi:hypothetical protein
LRAVNEALLLAPAIPLYPARHAADDPHLLPHGLPDANVNAVIPSGPDAVERISGQRWMTGIPLQVRAAPAVIPANHRKLMLER